MLDAGCWILDPGCLMLDNCPQQSERHSELDSESVGGFSASFRFSRWYRDSRWSQLRLAAGFNPSLRLFSSLTLTGLATLTGTDHAFMRSYLRAFSLYSSMQLCG
jgi:hypothetical protein